MQAVKRTSSVKIISYHFFKSLITQSVQSPNVESLNSLMFDDLSAVCNLECSKFFRGETADESPVLECI